MFIFILRDLKIWNVHWNESPIPFEQILGGEKKAIYTNAVENTIEVLVLGWLVIHSHTFNKAIIVTLKSEVQLLHAISHQLHKNIGLTKIFHHKY